MKETLDIPHKASIEDRKSPCICIDIGDNDYSEADGIEPGKIVAITIVGKMTAKTQRKDSYGRSASLTIEPSEISVQNLTKKSVFAELSED